MARVKLVWWIPITVCLLAGIVAMMPAATAGPGRFLPYQALMPWAPVSSIGIWLTGFLIYLLGKESTARAVRPKSR